MPRTHGSMDWAGLQRSVDRQNGAFAPPNTVHKSFQHASSIIPRSKTPTWVLRASMIFSLFSLTILLAPGVSTAAGPSRPNVIVILTDDQGRGDYSAFGTKDIRTPAIDRLCREGMTFDNFRANSCVCSPTRAALLTGCFPDRVGVPGVIRHTHNDSWGWLAPHAVLLPQILKSQGYHSAIVGKWHLGLASPNTPTERGFDFFHGFLGDMMDDYLTHRRGGQNFMRRNHDVIDPEGHATDLFTDWACDYLAERAKAQTRSDAARPNTPFFLYLAYNAPHDPIQPPTAWREKVRQREPDMAEARVGLVALIEQMDAGIGKVLETLDRLKLADNTLVFFTSDNGGLLRHQANNGPWRSEKQHMYEGGLRVPAIARWPNHIESGSHTARSAVTMDLFATIADAAGATTPQGIDGISFLPTLLGQASAENALADAQRELYFVRREGGSAYGGKTIEALIQGDWKLIQDNPFQPLELYNLAVDPQESRNRIHEEQAIAARLSALLRKHIQNGGQVAWQRPTQ
ncbi:sulfatase family protein [Schlesneria paludicola]|uniref:sulfatase family protein n=1 Tax=Schlesneria paludicola TaxID=360056 RepID=UPI001ED90F3F|nr:sulfatase-like hydrolase/transferase [Schlesneria paludicola]